MTWNSLNIDKNEERKSGDHWDFKLYMKEHILYNIE